MRILALLWIPAALVAGQARYARLGELEGRPEIRLHAGDTWTAAARNMPLIDGSWVRTGAGARVEIEFDEGSALRLGAESAAELSDYTRLSTGRRITMISLDRGVAYFTGAPEGDDTITLAVPGAWATLKRGTRLRLEAGDGWGRFAVLEGAVLFSCPAAELELREGQMARVEPANTSRFELLRELEALPSDNWSEERDRALASPGSAAHAAGLAAGLVDLDAAGTWIESAALGTVWKPKAPAGWAPFRNGRWVWYDGIGYTWISADPWGWLPYHYGRWSREFAGWAWVPGRDDSFSPGDVFWLRGSRLAAWGPLAPLENWTGEAQPAYYRAGSLTYAAWALDALEIDPAGFTVPKEPVAGFVAALPSPALPAARLEARRQALRPEITALVQQPPEPALPRAPGPVNTSVVQPEPLPPTVIVEPPAEPVYYPVPVYTGIVVVNPPERHREKERERRKEPEVVPTPVVRRPADPPRQERVETRGERNGQVHRPEIPQRNQERTAEGKEPKEREAAPAPVVKPPADPPRQERVETRGEGNSQVHRPEIPQRNQERAAEGKDPEEKRATEQRRR